MEELMKTDKYKIYADLKNKSYFIRSGGKYGADFLIYEQHPDYSHGKALIFCDLFLNIIEISRSAQSAKKEAHLAYIDEK